MRLNQIRDLIAVSEAGSLRAAARRIGISQPAMSKSLADLEREFQAQLLTRTSRGVALTAAGRAFVARARVVQGELRKVQEDLAALARRHRRARWPSVSGRRWACPWCPARWLVSGRSAPGRRCESGKACAMRSCPCVRDETLDFAVTEKRR